MEAHEAFDHPDTALFRVRKIGFKAIIEGCGKDLVLFAIFSRSEETKN